MNWNFENILERFGSKSRMFALLILVLGAISVPIALGYFDSDSRNCSEVLDENMKLTHRIVEISALFRKFQAIENFQEEMAERAVYSSADSTYGSGEIVPYDMYEKGEAAKKEITESINEKLGIK